MKRCIMLLCLVFCKTQNAIPAQQLKQELYSYVLKMRLPHHLEFHTPVPGFYKGSMLELGNNCTLISENNKVLTFSLIITPEVTFESQGNNVHFQRRLPDQPFLWYDLTLHTRMQASEDEDKKAYTWSIKKLSPQEAPLQIPDHAIIIYHNPELIEKLEDLGKPESFGKDNSHVIALPTIIVQSETDQSQFDKICDEAWLAALELRTIHQKESVETHQATPQTIINVCK